MVANGMFQAWWPMEGEGEVAWRPMEGEGEVSFAWRPMEGEGKVSSLGGQWNVPLLGGQWKEKEKEKEKFPCLVANGMWRKNPFHLFPPTNLLKPPFFSIDLEVLLYHGPRSLPTPFFPFPRSINYECASQRTKSFTPSLLIRCCLKIWFFSSPWNHGVAHGHILRAPSHSSEWRIAYGVIFRSDLNATSSWWRTQTSRSAHLSRSWTPSSLVLSYFSELSHFGHLVASRPHFWWRTWNRLRRLLQNRRYFYLCMVFSSWRWTLPLVVWSDSPTTS